MGIPIVVVIALVAYSLLKTSGPHPGEVAYENYCASCHGNDGKGVGELVPPVYQSSLLKENPDQLACIIIYGMQGPVEVNGVIYNQPMLGLEGQISEMELTNLVNFLLQEWNDVEERQTIKDIGKNLENCQFTPYSD